MRKFLLATLLLLGAATTASLAFAAGDEPIELNQVLRKSASTNTMTRYSQLLRTSGYGDTVYIGYTPGAFALNTKNYWSIRARTTTPSGVDGNGKPTHRPPAAGCMWTFDPAGEAGPNGYIHGDTLQGWWLVRGNYRSLGFRPTQGDLISSSANVDQGNVGSMWPYANGRNFGIIGVWHGDHGNDTFGGKLAKSVGWAPITGHRSAWCGLRIHGDTQIQDPHTKNYNNADIMDFNLQGGASTWHNFPGYCNQWDQMLYRDIDGAGQSGRNLTVSFKYIHKLSLTIDGTTRVGWFDKDPLGAVASAPNVACNTNSFYGGVNYIAANATAPQGNIVDSFMVYIGTPVGNSNFRPYNVPFDSVGGDYCQRMTNRRVIYDTLRRWFSEVLEATAQPQPLYKELLSVADSSAGSVSVSYVIPADTVGKWLAAGGNKVRLVFRVKTNGISSDESATFDSHTKGAAIVDDVTWAFTGGTSSPAGWGTFEVDPDPNGARVDNTVDNRGTATSNWKSTAKPPQNMAHVEQLAGGNAPYDDLCGANPSDVGRPCSMVNGVITFGVHDANERLGRTPPFTVDHDYRCDLWSPTIQLCGPYDYDTNGNNSPGGGYNVIGIKQTGPQGDADVGGSGDYYADYEIFAKTANINVCGIFGPLLYGWLAKSYPMSDPRGNREWGQLIISTANIQCDPICFRSIPGLTGQEGNMFSTGMVVWDDDAITGNNLPYPDSIRVGLWTTSQNYRPGVVSCPIGGTYVDNFSLTLVDAGGAPLSGVIWDFYNDAFPFNDVITPEYGARFDTTVVKIKTGVNNARAAAAKRYSTPADSMLVTANGSPPQRVDLIFRILPGPGNYVRLGDATSGVAQQAAGGTPSTGAGRTAAVASPNSSNFWQSYLANNGPFGTAGGHVGGWNPNVWNSCRCDTASNNVLPVLPVIGTPQDPATLFASTIHESEMNIAPANDLSVADPYPVVNLRSGLGLSRNRCFLSAPGAAVNDIVCSTVPAWVTSGAPANGYNGVATSSEFTKIIPDGLLAPGAHVEYFYRLSENGNNVLAGIMPDTTVVLPQLGERNNDSHRWQEFSALPDRWKTANYIHPVLGTITAGPACLLVIDGQDANQGGDEGTWVGVADTIGATEQKKWGAHNGWHARGGNSNPNVQADNISPEGVVGKFPSRHGGSPGTTWDLFQIKASESSSPAVPLGQRYSYTDPANSNPQIQNRQADVGPSHKQANFFYKSILFLTGALAGNLLGPYDERTSDDTGWLKDWITSGSASTPERWLITIGCGWAENAANQSTVPVAALHPDVFMHQFQGVQLVDPGYRNVGSLASLINLSPRRGGLLYDAFSPNKAWSIANLCTQTNDVINVSAEGADPGFGPAAIAAWYNTDSTYAASVYKPFTGSKPWIALTNGWMLSQHYNKGGVDSKGRAAFMFEILTKLFAGQNACKPAGSPIVGLDVPNLDDGNLLADFVSLRNNPYTSGFARIHFGMAKDDFVQIRVFDVSGRLVRTLADRGFKAGEHDLVWDGTDNSGRPVSRGVYFTQVKYRNSAFSDARKLTVLK